MFSAGTRAYVHVSAFSGKKLGPKRHSLGFVSEGEQVFVADYVRNFPNPKQSFILIPMQVVFTRFGKEHKSRMEAKSFLNIVPAFFSNFASDHSIETRTHEIIDIFKGDEFIKNSVWREITDEYAGSGATAGIMTPIYQDRPSVMDANDTEAWISAVLRNRYFTYLVMRNKNLPTLVRALYPHDNLLMWIANAVRDSSPRRDLMKWGHERRENMDALVVTLRKMTTMFNKSFSLSSHRSWRRTLSSHSVGPSDINSITSWALSGMLDKSETLAKKMVLIADNQKNIPSKIYGLSKTLPGVRAAYLSLKPKHI
jgi:hypothetical protein